MAVHSHFIQAFLGRNNHAPVFHYMLNIWYNAGHASQQFFHCCECICCCGNMFTESLPCNSFLFGLQCSGFQASGHIQFKKFLTCFLHGPGHINYPISSERK
jgi:hypothetical protein